MYSNNGTYISEFKPSQNAVDVTKNPHPKSELGLVSLFNGISTFMVYLMLEEQQWCYLTHSCKDKGVLSQGYLSESKPNSV